MYLFLYLFSSFFKKLEKFLILMYKVVYLRYVLNQFCNGTYTLP